jgi:hypothetical protein
VHRLLSEEGYLFYLASKRVYGRLHGVLRPRGPRVFLEFAAAGPIALNTPTVIWFPKVSVPSRPSNLWPRKEPAWLNPFVAPSEARLGDAAVI